MPGPIEKRSGILLGDPSASSLDFRTAIKRCYHEESQRKLGEDIKDYWNGDRSMSRLEDLDPIPEICESRRLDLLCNKSTILYWKTSAQSEDFGIYSRIIFACIYKCWFRFHESQPSLNFGKFVAHPFRITRNGPQTIPDILKAHGCLCSHIASQLSLKKGTDGVTHPIGRSQWQHYHLLPLCRAMITLLDRGSLPPEIDEDIHVLLDHEVQRWTVILVLTGERQGLSEAVNFDAIRSESLPLKRHDVGGIDGANIVRMLMRTAVHFIAGLQRREEIALSNSSQGCVGSKLKSDRDGVSKATHKSDEYGGILSGNPCKNKWNWSAIENTTAMKREGILTAFKDADEYADAVLNHTSRTSWKLRVIERATLSQRAIEEGRFPPQDIVVHWNRTWT